MTIRLEDNFEDVLSKALSGLQMSKQDLAKSAKIPVDRIEALLEGNLDSNHLYAVAPYLKLDGSSLLRLAERKSNQPEVKAPNLHCFNSPFPVPGYEEMTVNSYLYQDPQSANAFAFDAGADATEMIRIIREEKLNLKAIFLTHSHRDHVVALEELLAQTGLPPVFLNKAETITNAKSFSAGESFSFDKVVIESRLTSGHSPGGTTFVIQSAKTPIAIVGDAIFACSIGGAANAYQEALREISTQILSLPDETVLCPGHGPLTTVKIEKANNPFFANAKP